MKTLLTCSLAILVFLSVPFADAGEGPTAKDLGLVLKQLSEEDLDQIEAGTGYRVGVLVAEVEAGSAAEKAGLKVDDVIFTVGTTGVRSPAAVDRALSGQTGSVEVLGMRAGLEDWETVRVRVVIPAAVPAAKPDPVAEAGKGNRAAALEAKLAALEKARAAGVLSDDEYAAKKAEIRKELDKLAPAPDAKTKARLDALDKAKAAGILTEEEYAKKRAEILGKAAGKDAAAKKPDPRGRKGKLYRHVVGFQFWYPDGWTVKRQGELLQLVPPDAAMSPQGPKELYLIGGESVAEDGITRPDDPRVAAYFDEQIRSLSPILKRTGKTETIKTPFGTGAVMAWEGESPSGDVIRATVRCCILKQNGISLISLGFKDIVAKRDAVIRQVFDSFGFGEGQKDKALVGKWHLLKTTGITNNSPFETDWSRARAVSDEKTQIEFRADGTWTRVVDWHMIAIAGGVSMESRDRDVTEGRWNAGNGKLVLISKGDVWEEYRYDVRGTELRLTGEKRGEIWSRK
jgi:hypothetical protein